NILTGYGRSHGNAGILAERRPLAPGKLGGFAFIVQAKQIPAEVDHDTFASDRYLAAAEMRIVVAAGKTAGPLVGFWILICLVMIVAPAFVSVGIETVNDGAQVLEVNRIVSTGRRTGDWPADVNALVNFAAGRIEDVKTASRSAVIDTSLH